MDGLNRDLRDYDLIIRNGTLVDGTGEDSVLGDIAIKDGIIAAIGEVQGKAKTEIDAKNKKTGKVLIHYSTAEELENIIGKLV